MSDKMWMLDNHLTEEQRPRVAEWLHMLGVERASFTAVQDLSGVRIEFRRNTSTAPGQAAIALLREWARMRGADFDDPAYEDWDLRVHQFINGPQS